MRISRRAFSATLIAAPLLARAALKLRAVPVWVTQAAEDLRVFYRSGAPKVRGFSPVRTYYPGVVWVQVTADPARTSLDCEIQPWFTAHPYMARLPALTEFGFTRIDDFGYARSFSITSDSDFLPIAVSMYRALTILYDGEEELQDIPAFDGHKPPPPEEAARILAEFGCEGVQPTGGNNLL